MTASAAIVWTTAGLVYFMIVLLVLLIFQTESDILPYEWNLDKPRRVHLCGHAAKVVVRSHDSSAMVRSKPCRQPGVRPEATSLMA